MNIQPKALGSLRDGGKRKEAKDRRRLPQQVRHQSRLTKLSNLLVSYIRKTFIKLTQVFYLFIVVILNFSFWFTRIECL